jgi:hypothetical protein
MAATTEITIVTGERFRVEGGVKEVERLILDAARGSIMQFAWLEDCETGRPLGLNPDQVVSVRPVGT